MEIERSIASITGVVNGSLQGGDLPEWFLIELLSRLPIEDVFRFNCVSKQFYSFISDPSFRRSYFSRLPSPPQDQFVFFPTRCRRGHANQEGTVLKYPERHFFTLPTPRLEGEESSSRRMSSSLSSRRRSSSLSFPPLAVESWAGGGSFYTVADDKGFLLVGWVITVEPGVKQDRCRGEFFICSAITHQWFSLPSSPPNPFVIETVGFVTQVEETGRFLTSYRVIIINSTVENILGTFVPDYVDFQVFSSETRSWLPVRLQIGNPFMFYRWQRPVLLNNTVYWTDPHQGILGYDPYAKPNEFSFIKPPPWKHVLINGYRRNEFGRGYSTCGVYQGRLKYFEMMSSMCDGSWEILRIWELQEKNKWRLQHTISMRKDDDGDDPFAFNEDTFNLHTAIFLSFHQQDPDIVYLNMFKNIGVASYNIVTKSMELCNPSSSMNGNVDLVGNYRWFLLKLPPWPILIPPYIMCKQS